MSTGRQYANIRTDIWRDSDWRELPVDAQWLYALMLSQPTLNTAGVLPLQQTKWSRCAMEMTIERVAAAVGVLCDRSYIVVDTDTEEVLIRSYMRHGLWGTGSWKVMSAALRAAIAVQSEGLRVAIWSEIQRLEGFERPELEDLVNALVDTLSDRVCEGVSDTPSMTYGIGPVVVGVSSLKVTNNQTELTTKIKEESVAKKAAPKRGTRLPDGWMPAQATVDAIKVDFPNVSREVLRREHEQFVDWAKSCSTQAAVKRDWDAAWRNWMRRELAKLPTNGNSLQGADAKAMQWERFKQPEQGELE